MKPHRPALLSLIAIVIALLTTISPPTPATARAAASKKQQLRVMSYNIHVGVGMDKKLDLQRIADVINAQHNYTDALIDKANAIIDYNSSQARLLHAIGCLTVDTCTASQPLRREI